MKRPASEYFRRNVWIAADPEERMFPLILRFAGDERFFIGSDYPHAEGFVNPVEKVTTLLADFPPQTTRRILVDNARAFYGIEGRR
jgi:predicted TIM-barrel fold metal-dependent hydrolase